MRSRAQWQAHPQGVAVGGLPLIGLRRLDEPSPGSAAFAVSVAPDGFPGSSDSRRSDPSAGAGLTSLPGSSAGSGTIAHPGPPDGPRSAPGPGSAAWSGSAAEFGAFASAAVFAGGAAREGAVGGGGRPLEGVRVLDLTRVIAGPVATRTLAAYGAEVLRVGAAHLPEVPGLVISTALGKRSCEIDLRTPEGAAAFRELVASADVVVQSYRPGALARLGFGPRELAAMRADAMGARRGLVCVDISAYGSRGPWAGRRGFDSLVQMACGIAHEQGEGARPVPLPAQVLDHATGWLAALGAIAGLLRSEREGGSWHVELSLARTALWLDGLGRVDGMAAPEPRVGDLLEEMESSFGKLTYVRAPGAVADVRPFWSAPPPRRGEHPPTWV
ncbi:CoA transferase [Sphaerisporangium dianthi]|uniref:CoA transferase n=1 Tax=Sphaerisporangium dianthi TaxID=1436120 RepID=A0ABV9CSZ5_9ACTN